MNWYDKFIEEPIRKIVRLLRNNGFNTTHSCGHEMAIDCEYYLEWLVPLRDLLINNGYEKFRITVHVERNQFLSEWRSGRLTILLPKEDGSFSTTW